MTNSLRLKKILELSKVSDHVGSEEIFAYGYAALNWPYPLTKQVAHIDTNTGEVIKWTRQSGDQVWEAPINLKIIDRRINYLYSGVKNG